MGAAAGEGPANNTGFWLLDLPSGALLSLMMPPTFGAEIALVGPAVGVGDCVVKVSVDGLRIAARGVAGGRAGTDQVGELPAGDVTGLCHGVVATAPGDGLRGEVQAAKERSQPGRLGRRGRSLTWRPYVLSFRCPGMLPW